MVEEVAPAPGGGGGDEDGRARRTSSLISRVLRMQSGRDHHDLEAGSRPSRTGPSRTGFSRQSAASMRKSAMEDLEQMYKDTYAKEMTVRGKSLGKSVMSDAYRNRLEAFKGDPEAGTFNMDTKVGVETAAEYFARQAAEQDRRDREERRQARKDIRKRMLKTGLIKDDDMMRVDRARHRTTKAESAWFYTQSVMSLLDLAVAAALIYVGFITFKDDPLIDPIAWQLAFGLTAVMIMIKFGLVVSDVQKGYAGWLGISCALSAGLLYGCVHRFFLLYNGQFPCFIGYDTWDPVPMCLTGMTFVALGGSVLFLLVDGALFYKYCQHRDYVKRKRTAGGHKEATLEDMMVHIELRMLQAMEREQSRVDGPGQAYLADSARGNKGTAGRSRQPSMAGVLRERSIVGSEVADAINKSRMSRMSIPGGEPRPGDLDLDHRKKSMKPLPAVVGEPGSQRTGNEADAARPPMRMLGDPIAQSNRAYSLRKQQSLRGPAPFSASGNSSGRLGKKSPRRNKSLASQRSQPAARGASVGSAPRPPAADGAPGPSRFVQDAREAEDHAFAAAIPPPPPPL